MNTNCQFPYIQYASGKSSKEWGRSHGEEFRVAIKELAEIRKSLMLAKNPSLSKKLDELAFEQLELSRKFAPHLASEIEGIAAGAALSNTDLVILNNYTDFRDITLPEEGCSTVHIQTQFETLSGQTWDMHRSAKNYMCILHVPSTDTHTSQLVLTLVGCVGLMGVNTDNCLIGVNNINTTNARTGIIWPLLVRKVLEAKSLREMQTILFNAPVTSGHNYLISSPEGGAHLEITPSVSEKVSALNRGQVGGIFHTNHCLGFEVEKLEDKLSISSTTYKRYELLSNKTHKVSDLVDFKNLLTDHDNFPLSICSHFENGAQDPSFTCGGGVSDLIRGNHLFWRGCPAHDSDYKEHEFELIGRDFKKIR
ncbi:MAG: C45 family peptidase [Bacteriovorax sp.]|jgi:isopenicillin-N N-acyltransferase-like protein